MQDDATPATPRRRALRDADRSAAGVAGPAVLDRAWEGAPSQAEAPPRGAARATALGRGGRKRRWVPRAAVLGALGAVTIAVPLAGQQPAGTASALGHAGASASRGTAGTTAEALAGPVSGVVGTLVAGGAVVEEAAVLTADPAAATRAVAAASRAYLREALECPVQSGANGPLSAVMGGAEVERLTMPVAEGAYRITSDYGFRSYPFYGLHPGTDFAGSVGTPLHAVADGVVTYAGGPRDGRSGNIIVITAELDGQAVDFWYGHMYADGVLVEVGETVVAGQVIGEIGNAGNSTGPHLHFEVHPGSGSETADPLAWLQVNGAQPVSALPACPA